MRTGRHALISIHAPRTGSDYRGRSCLYLDNYFNPRSPHGERRADISEMQRGDIISIHAPRTGSDVR